MRIIAHRGYWLSAQEKNTEVAFYRAFSIGFGTETDVRDCLESLVIAHDMSTPADMPLTQFLTLAQRHPPPPLLAIDIKANGLADSLKYAMCDYPRKDWFAFDMSIPDMRKHLDVGNPVFARMTELERDPPWFDEIAGIFLHGFNSTWYDISLIKKLLNQGKQVCVVSPEIEGRDPLVLWGDLRAIMTDPGLILCTHIPEKARAFFA